ncbi:MAG TPA: RNA methyltransferase [Nitrospinota bacterium]|jgi:hypothetical protein|nr:RNA methyltransferase [Nitrospinota bacterium]|tara:strand:+ start:166559 stop:167146 length:588 start_codon:yes stop_codon:yes gene_type:complete
MSKKEDSYPATTGRPELAIGLVHNPVVNKYGETVTSSITTIDVHDMARMCKTFDISALYVVTPLKSHQRLVERVAKHWTSGFGAEYNPSRKKALGLVKVVDSIDDMLNNFSSEGRAYLLIATSGRGGDKVFSFPEVRNAIWETGRAVLLFGTAHGLAGSVIGRANMLLEPIRGVSDYNHLPVRAAVAIILDRLLS